MIMHHCFLLPLLLLSLSSFPFLAEAQSTTTIWHAISYPSCRSQYYPHQEGFAPLDLDENADTNYLGSTTWHTNVVDDDEEVDRVEGTSYVCLNASNLDNFIPDVSPVLNEISCRKLVRPPLALYECVLFPTSSTLCLIYLAIGTPIVFISLWLLHYQHIQLLRKSTQELGHKSMPMCGDASYGFWPYFLSDKNRASAYYLGSPYYVYFRTIQLQHSLACFFFVSSVDSFNWKWRSVVLVMEQIFNFAVNALISSLFLQNAHLEFPWTVVVTLFITVPLIQIQSQLFPIRRLLAYTVRNTTGWRSALVKIYIFISIFVRLSLSAFFMYEAFKPSPGPAPSQNRDLTQYIFMVYISSIPFNFLSEYGTICLNISLSYWCCCGLCRSRYLRSQRVNADAYAKKFCFTEEGIPIGYGVRKEKSNTMPGTEMMKVERGQSIVAPIRVDSVVVQMTPTQQQQQQPQLLPRQSIASPTSPAPTHPNVAISPRSTSSSVPFSHPHPQSPLSAPRRASSASPTT